MPATAAELVAGIFDSEAEGVAALQAAADAHAASPADARELYAEPFFPADSRALFRDADRPTAGHAPLEMVEWRRAAAICSDGGGQHALFKQGVEPGDVIQGMLGDCWFLGVRLLAAAAPAAAAAAAAAADAPPLRQTATHC